MIYRGYLRPNLCRDLRQASFLSVRSQHLHLLSSSLSPFFRPQIFFSKRLRNVESIVLQLSVQFLFSSYTIGDEDSES